MAAHRYWRLYITETQLQSTYTSIAELEFYDSRDSTTDLTGADTASASSYYDAARAPAAAFANNLGTTYWNSLDGTKPQWIAYDFGAGNDVEINVVKMWARTDNSGGARDQTPSSFFVQYSDDGTTWSDWWFEHDHTWLNSTTNPPKTFYRPYAEYSEVDSSVALDESSIAALVGGGGQVIGGSNAAILIGGGEQLVGGSNVALLIGGGGSVIGNTSVAILLGKHDDYDIDMSSIAVVFGGTPCVEESVISVVYKEIIGAVNVALDSEDGSFYVSMDDASHPFKIRVE